MEFDWDPAKDAANQIKHGNTFRAAILVFADPFRSIEDSTRPGHGEPRRKAIGQVANSMVTVIFTDRDGVRRIISAGKARRDERTRYGAGAAAG